jgi:hypothetical protein
MVADLVEMNKQAGEEEKALADVVKILRNSLTGIDGSIRTHSLFGHTFCHVNDCGPFVPERAHLKWGP